MPYQTVTLAAFRLELQQKFVLLLLVSTFIALTMLYEVSTCYSVATSFAAVLVLIPIWFPERAFVQMELASRFNVSAFRTFFVRPVSKVLDMEFVVLNVVGQYKIFYAIVQFVVVLVVDGFSFCKRSVKRFGHDCPMNRLAYSIHELCMITLVSSKAHGAYWLSYSWKAPFTTPFLVVVAAIASGPDGTMTVGAGLCHIK